MIKIFNSYTQKKEALADGIVGIYVCGITPYDTTHLGHAFTFIIFDVLVRALRFLNYKVTYVQNVTDVDDDILLKAKSQAISWKKLGRIETQKHIQNLDRLNFLRPDFSPKATEHIDTMIQITGVLVQKGLAYQKNGNVYFDIKKDKNFGKLSKLNYQGMLEIANERGNFPLDPNKRDPLDFVLWQKSKPGEPSWDSPWGKGRPGWHIECSAMAMRYLGSTISIHGGGADLIFPHHEAEIAISENFTGKKFVKIWMHTAMVYSDGKKMSKSLGNMIFIADLLKKYSPNVIRILLLSHHFHKPWNYQESQFEKAIHAAKILEQSAKESNRLTNAQVKKMIPMFFKALDDNLDAPLAIKKLLEFTLDNIAHNKSTHKGEIVFKCAQILGLKI